MSRFCGAKDPTPMIEAADRLRARCLLGNSAVFSDDAIWTAENVAGLEEYFSKHPDSGDRSFLEKLEDQLEPASGPVVKLAAEILWLMLLCPSNIGPDRKRETFGKVYGWSGDELPDEHPMLSDLVLSGIGSAGTGYNTKRNRELRYCIELLRRLFALSSPERETLLADGWRFAEWLEPIDENDSRQLRHMVLYLLFPDTFERIFGGTDRRTIAIDLSGRSRKEARSLQPVELDRLLAEIRQRYVDEYETEELDFYTDPLRELWKAKRDEKRRQRRTYLLSWNPGNWEWESLDDDRRRTARGEAVRHSWSCANSKASVGDKAYLVRGGDDLGGVVAVGNIVRESYDGPSWDEERAGRGETARFVDVDFTSVRDGERDEYVTAEALRRVKADDQNWTPHQSGIEVQPKAAAMLDRLWGKLRPVSSVSPGPPGPDVGEPMNLILYGPPGTGKTYHLRQREEEYIEQTASTEEWRDSIVEEMSWFDVIFAALHALGGSARVPELVRHEFVQSKAKLMGRMSGLGAQVWANLQVHTRVDSTTVKAQTRRAPYVFDKDPESCWSLVDDWREECAEQIALVERIRVGPSGPGTARRRYEFVTFHQAYSYEDFVEGIRPQETEEGDVTYSVQPGVFRRICQAAKNDPAHRYAIFIDEINRGNIAKILGELITLIEPDKRAVYDAEGELVSGMELTLPYSRSRFGVPRNLDVIATMNTADRSIALLDTALRRRFVFRELMPDPGIISGATGDGEIPDGEGGTIDLRALLTAINRRMRFLLGRDQQLGHSYFTAVKDFAALKRVLLQQVIPLLQEYFYEDWRRIQLVLRDVGPAGEPLEPQLVCHEAIREVDALGFDHADFEDVVDYWVAAEPEVTPSAVRKIYEDES